MNVLHFLKYKKCIFLFSFMFLLLSSCEVLHNFGYPNKVNFRSCGGEIVVSGDDVFHAVQIENGNGDCLVHEKGDIAEADTIIIAYDWLTVKYKHYDSKITIIAEPNTTHKSRRYYVSFMVKNSLADIKVTQN